MSICVQDVMVREVITVDSAQSVKNAARLMAKFGISGLVVLTNGDLVGILTERDILTRVVTSGQNPEEISVKEIMTEPVIVVNPIMPLEKAVAIMLLEKIKKLPVVTKVDESLRLIGILSITDIARLHPKLLETLKAVEQMNTDAQKAEAGFYIR